VIRDAAGDEALVAPDTWADIGLQQRLRAQHTEIAAGLRVGQRHRGRSN
jgi:hypothetical protein